MALKDAFFAEKKRYLTAAALIILLIAVLWVDSLYIFWVVLGLFFLLGFNEALTLFNSPKHPASFLLAGITWFLALFSTHSLESALFFGMLLAGFLAYRRNFSARYLLAFIYPTMPFLALLEIYKSFGGNAIIWLIVIIAVCDSAAYFGGRVFGRTPFCATSPKKTIEGVVIGITLAVCIGSLLGVGIIANLNFFSAIIMSLIIAFSGVLGDLFESYLKREAGLKDSGKILPGHGGVLDRFDASLFGAIAMLFLLHLGSIGKAPLDIPLG